MGIKGRLALVFGSALVAAACSGSGSVDTTTTTAAPPTSTTSSTTTTSSTSTTSTTLAKVDPTLQATDLTYAVQQDLEVLGYFDDVIDGIYGPVTTAAVTAFQKDAGIEVDGEFGPQTGLAMAKALAKDKDYVEDLQKDLKEIGLYSGPIDGDYGKGTRAAVEKLEEGCELHPKVDGWFDPLTHVCLNMALKS